MEAPLLSVCLITYNHAQYIKQAIDSVLMQKVNFTWELIIADDFSTDGTREIILEYKNAYPEFIKLILQDKNVGPAKNWLSLLSYPKSKFIAYIEGDDYWIDPLKLQKQTNFLENNLEFSAVHSAVKGLEGTKILEPSPYKQWNYKTNILDLKDAIYFPIAFTATILFRNDIQLLLSNKYTAKLYSGDWALFIVLSIYGNFYFFNEYMAVYRQNVGISDKRNWKEKYIHNALFLLNLISFKRPLKVNFELVHGALFYLLSYLPISSKIWQAFFKKIMPNLSFH